MDIHIEYTASPAPAPAPVISRLEMGIPVHDTPSHHIMALPGKLALGLAIAVSPMGVSTAYHPPLLPMRFSGGSPIKSAIIPQKISLANSLASAHRGRISHGGHGVLHGERGGKSIEDTEECSFYVVICFIYETYFVYL